MENVNVVSNPDEDGDANNFNGIVIFSPGFNSSIYQFPSLSKRITDWIGIVRDINIDFGVCL